MHLKDGSRDSSDGRKCVFNDGRHKETVKITAHMDETGSTDPVWSMCAFCNIYCMFSGEEYEYWKLCGQVMAD